jgi:hypothetical protein
MGVPDCSQGLFCPQRYVVGSKYRHLLWFAWEGVLLYHVEAAGGVSERGEEYLSELPADGARPGHRRLPWKVSALLIHAQK